MTLDAHDFVVNNISYSPTDAKLLRRGNWQASIQPVIEMRNKGASMCFFTVRRRQKPDTAKKKEKRHHIKKYIAHSRSLLPVVRF